MCKGHIHESREEMSSMVDSLDRTGLFYPVIARISMKGKSIEYGR